MLVSKKRSLRLFYVSIDNSFKHLGLGQKQRHLDIKIL